MAFEVVRDIWNLLSMKDQKPHDPAVEADQAELTELYLSAELGQLLIALIGSYIDNGRLWELNPLFRAADLREAPLPNGNLRGATFTGVEGGKADATLAQFQNAAADVRRFGSEPCSPRFDGAEGVKIGSRRAQEAYRYLEVAGRCCMIKQVAGLYAGCEVLRAEQR